MTFGSPFKKRSTLFGVLFVFACLLLYGYSVAQTDTPPSAPPPVKIPPPIEGIEAPAPVQQPQKLDAQDIRIFTAQGQTHVFRVEIARTPDQQRMGLMFRNEIKPLSGMLFLFSDDAEKAFWMRNTWIPLDILFIRRDGIIRHIHPDAVPGSLERIHSNGPVRAVLEVPGGTVEALNIAIGDRVMYDAAPLQDAE